MREVEHRCSLDDPPRLTAIVVALHAPGAARPRHAESSWRSRATGDQIKIGFSTIDARAEESTPSPPSARRSGSGAVWSPWTVFTNGRKPRPASSPLRLR